MKTCENDKGFTLIELIVVMAIFSMIIMVSARAFETIMAQSSQMKKASESNIEGVVGLEMLRKDLESAGYGLPWGFVTGITYAEADVATDFIVEGFDPMSLNDSPSDVPRAVASGVIENTKKILDGSGKSNGGSSYLAIKSVNVAFNDAARKWSFVNFSASVTSGTNDSYIRQWSSAPENFSAADSIITLVSSYSSVAGSSERQLVSVSNTDFSYKYSGIHPPNDIYKPLGRITRPSDNAVITTDLYAVHGINNLGSGANTIRMPFNRADYYLKRPQSNMASYCNKGTGVLYKGLIVNSTSDSGGGYLQYPLLDCVGDMQVVYELDTSGTGNIAYLNTLAGLTALDVRNQLRSIRVYILAHEGKKDRNFNYSYKDSNKVIVVGDPNISSLGRVFSVADMVSFFGDDWMNYRWKVYSISVHPKNLAN
ncbi:MAG: prepilin-type N-terminal cleavage/methylation domain-containing protein [Pelobacteraceae bacterium]